MESDDTFYRYIKISVIALVIMAVGVFAFWFFAIKVPASKQTVIEPEPASREIKLVDKTVLNRMYEYTSENIAPAEEVKIYGQFISADPEQATIDGDLYIYVIGLRNEDGSISRVHLKREEYEILGGTLDKKKFWVTLPVVVTINSLGIYIQPIIE